MSVTSLVQWTRPFAVALAALAVGGLVTSCAPSSASSRGPGAAPIRVVTDDDVLAQLAGDPECFTQGLEVASIKSGEPTFHVSCGDYGRSEYVLWTPATGERVASDLPDAVFAEGFTWVVDAASGFGLQLTWQEHTVFRQPGGEVAGEIPTEGWGICYDESSGNVWVSDGSATLTSYDPNTMDATGAQLEVSDAGHEIDMLNELECADGAIWANVWLTNEIVKIDPASGRVLARLDLTSVVGRESARQGSLSRNQTLNGIAISGGRVFVTGKQWERIYELDPVVLG